MTEQERAAALADGMEYDVHIGRYPRDETHDLIVAALRLLAATPAAAPLPPIEREGSREYIPLLGGWEIQTKGDGSSYRLCDTKTGERLNILGGDGPTAQDFVTRMAREVRAASLLAATPAASSVVTDEMVNRAFCVACCGPLVGASDGQTYELRTPTMQTMRAALEAALKVKEMADD